MANNYPPFPFDEDEDAQNASDMDAEGVGDLAPKQKQPQQPYQLPPPPPQASQAQQAYQQYIQSGAPPQPHPKIWQRLLAAGVGGLAGVANAQAGYPGGPKARLDPSAAVDNILGATGYQQRLKNWTQQAATMEKSAEEERKRNSDATRQWNDLLLGQERAENTASLRESRLSSAQNRNLTAEANMQNRRQQYAADNVGAQEIPEAAWQQPARDFSINPTQQSPSGIETEDMPGLPGSPPPMPDLPVHIGGPTFPQLTPQGYNPAPPPPPGFDTQGQRMFTPTRQTILDQQAKKAEDQKTALYHTVTPAEVQMFGGAKLPLPYQPNDKVEPTTWNKYLDDLHQAQRPAPSEASKPTFQEINVARSLGISEKDFLAGNYTPAQAAQIQAKLKPPPAQNNTTFTLPSGAFSSPPPALAPGKRDEQFLSTLPVAEQMTVKRYADYKGILPTGYAMAKNQGYWDNLFNAVSRYTGEEFDPKEYPARQALETDYTSNKPNTTGGNITSLDTLTQHIDQLMHDMGGLNNGDQQSLNSVSNWLSKEFGQAPITNAALAKQAVAAELARALKGTATEGEINRWVDSLSLNMSPQQIAEAKQTMLRLMAARYNAIQQTYTARQGKPWRAPISPIADQTLRQNGIDTTSIHTGQISQAQPGGAPGGGGAALPTLQPGQSLTSSDVGKVYMIKGEARRIVTVNPKNPRQYKSEPAQ